MIDNEQLIRLEHKYYANWEQVANGQLTFIATMVNRIIIMWIITLIVWWFKWPK